MLQQQQQKQQEQEEQRKGSSARAAAEQMRKRKAAVKQVRSRGFNAACFTKHLSALLCNPCDTMHCAAYGLAPLTSAHLLCLQFGGTGSSAAAAAGDADEFLLEPR